MGEEADALWGEHMCAAGEEFGLPEPEFEVIKGKRQEVVFAGSRADCWTFRKLNGGFVRPCNYDDEARK